MEDDQHHQQTHVDDISQHLPQVLILEDLDPPPILKHHGDYRSKKFKLLKAWESSLALDQFLATHAQSVRALLCSGHYLLTANILRHLPSLQLVVSTSSGLNNIDFPECKRLGIAVANAGNAYAEDVADMAVGLLIDLLRKISSSDGFVRQGLWSTANGGFPLGSKLGGKRVGIVGLGRIGLEVAKRLEAFGCKIMYNSRKQKPFVSYPYYSSVCDLASETDALIICCGLTDQTCNMINKPVMNALGKKGVIVNVGRGAIINEKELVQCLVEEKLGGAGLDVFENEPLVPQELFTLQNVVLSPHRAMFTPESLCSVCEVLVGNLENFFSNMPLISQVIDV